MALHPSPLLRSGAESGVLHPHAMRLRLQQDSWSPGNKRSLVASRPRACLGTAWRSRLWERVKLMRPTEADGLGSGLDRGQRIFLSHCEIPCCDQGPPTIMMGWASGLWGRGQGDQSTPGRCVLGLGGARGRRLRPGKNGRNTSPLSPGRAHRRRGLRISRGRQKKRS